MGISLLQRDLDYLYMNFEFRCYAVPNLARSLSNMSIENGTIIDGVHRYPINGIKVVVVGAGVAGLGTALECWRKGCEVTVLERGEKLSTLGWFSFISCRGELMLYLGDYFTLPPSALVNMKYFPHMLEMYHTCVYDCTISLWTPSGKELFSKYPEWKRDNTSHVSPDVNVSFLNMRSQWAKMQLDQLNRLSIPVVFRQVVTGVEESEEEVVVSTQGGEEYSCDLCVVANGIATKMKGFETSGAVHVADTGYAVARVAFPLETIRRDSPAYELVKDVKQHPDFRVYVGKDVHLILFLTAGHVAWVFTHKVRLHHTIICRQAEFRVRTTGLPRNHGATSTLPTNSSPNSTKPTSVGIRPSSIS